MRIRWLRTAVKNVDEVAHYIAADSPAAATHMVQRISTSVQSLKQHPSLGRPGRVPGTRELIVPNSPYLIPYRVKGDEIQILRVFHTAQLWPGD